MKTVIELQPDGVVGRRDPKIYGQFVEHFHRQVYGGLYEPSSPLADGEGLRKDVLEAAAAIRPAVIRWPGGCFASAYHWKNGVGAERVPQFDKAWRVEESNRFGTDEFIRFCRKVKAEPFICTNAGTGTPEEMAEWVEYCNLSNQGRWAGLRIAGGHAEPYRVKYWSIGNENYGSWEIGARSAAEWGPFVRESAKLMKGVDPSIELSAASIADMEWNTILLREAGSLLDWISIHHYWDPLWENNNLSGYEACMAHTLTIGEQIESIERILSALGYLGKIRIAFDEWNLRGWHHPRSGSSGENLRARDRNDANESYTMADAVFSACFLNQCLSHCNTVGMANFAPLVNTRGAIFTHPDGIVLRPTYHVFRMYSDLMGETVLDTVIRHNHLFEAPMGIEIALVPSIDAVGTRSADGQLRLAVVNRRPERPVEVEIQYPGVPQPGKGVLHSLVGASKDSYNDIDRPDDVGIERIEVPVRQKETIVLDLPPHSVHVLCLPVE
jgi:alpha-N-arabinofuranosidase